MSTPIVDKILLALKTIVNSNVNFHYCQGFESSESYDGQENQLPLLAGAW